MKVKEFAKIQGISPQAVYQRLKTCTKKTGQPLSAYVSDDTSEITDEGYKLLRSLYKKQPKKKDPAQSVETDQVKEIEILLDEERKLNQQLTIETEKQKEQIKALNLVITAKEREISRLEETVANERQVNRMLLESLPRERPGFFRRLFSGKQEQKPAQDKTPDNT